MTDDLIGRIGSGYLKPEIANLKSHKSTSSVSCKEWPILRSGEELWYRDFFPIDRLSKEQIVDGHINKFLYPV